MISAGTVSAEGSSPGSRGRTGSARSMSRSSRVSWFVWAGTADCRLAEPGKLTGDGAAVGRDLGAAGQRGDHAFKERPDDGRAAKPRVLLWELPGRDALLDEAGENLGQP